MKKHINYKKIKYKKNIIIFVVILLLLLFLSSSFFLIEKDYSFLEKALKITYNKLNTYIISNSYNKKAASIAAAFSLYLDFINIFIYVLRILLILGKNSSRNK